MAAYALGRIQPRPLVEDSNLEPVS